MIAGAIVTRCGTNACCWVAILDQNANDVVSERGAVFASSKFLSLSDEVVNIIHVDAILTQYAYKCFIDGTKIIFVIIDTKC